MVTSSINIEPKLRSVLTYRSTKLRVSIVGSAGSYVHLGLGFVRILIRSSNAD